MTRLDQSEVERAKAANSEAAGECSSLLFSTSDVNFYNLLARKALDDLEKVHAQSLRERRTAEERAAKMEQNLRDVEKKLIKGDRQSTDLESIRQRLEEELQEE